MTRLFNKLVALIWDFVAVKRSSWHYKMVNELSDNGDTTTDPLDYWLSYGPIILVMLCARTIHGLTLSIIETAKKLKDLATEFGMNLLLGILFEIFPWFLGFSIDDNPTTEEWYLPHRLTNDGKMKLFVPWEIVFISFPFYMGMVVWFGIHPNIWIIMAALSPLLLIRVKATPEPKPKLDL